MLSRIAQQHADEIRQHDWSDAPWRIDRAGHSREHDTGPLVQVDERRQCQQARQSARRPHVGVRRERRSR